MKNKHCQNGIPTRFILVGMLVFGTTLSYMIRSDISLTIVAMINKTALEKSHNNSITNYPDDDGSCPISHSNSSSDQTDYEGSFVWNSNVQGLIVGGFFYGYAATMLIGGRMAEKYGAKLLIGCGVFLGSVFTALVPLVSNFGYGPLLALRILTGMTQGPIYPGMSALFPKWIPPSERTRLYAICCSGAFLGIILSMPLVGWLCVHGFSKGWDSVFYIFGLCGIVWSVIWMLVASNSAEEHPRISPAEKKFILDSLPSQIVKKPNVPWKSILTSMRVWVYVFVFTANSWTSYTRLTELPNFLDQALHVPIETNGLIVALLNSCAFVTSICGGFFADFLINRKYLSKTNVRKLIECTALLGCSGCMIAMTLSGCNITAVICWLTLASSLQAISSSGDIVLSMDMAPNFAGTLLGFGNTFCAVAGFLSPLVTGYILGFEDIGMSLRWHYVFYLTTGLSVAGALVTIFFWSAEVQPWNEVNDLMDDKHILVHNGKSKPIN